MTKAKISRTWGTILLHIIAIILCFTLAGNTAAVEQIDQSNLPEWAGGWTHLNPAAEDRAAMWQTFTPARPNLTAVEIDVLTISAGRGDDTLTVEISKDENILASAERYVEDGFDGLLRFEFSEAVSLVPEQIYELKVRDTGITRFGWKYGSNSYERGSRYVLSQESPNSDWLFQTYSQVEPTAAKYSGGSGEPNDPYQIATADDLIALGESPEDYDKHFILTADIDLDPNLPGGKVFDKAVIAADINDRWPFDGTPFSGVFNGNGHTISHLVIDGGGYLGLFGQLESTAEVKNLGVMDVNITSYLCAGDPTGVGGLTGSNVGTITLSYSTGTVTGGCNTGGLVGYNGGSISTSYSTVMVTGLEEVGGLVGHNDWGGITSCHSSGTVTGHQNIGGLVGENNGSITTSFSDSTVTGDEYGIGGLLGFNNGGSITASYSSGSVNGVDWVGGLVGWGGGNIAMSYWDIEASNRPNMCGDQDHFGPIDCDNSYGKTTAEMKQQSTFEGWDFVNETVNGLNDVWKIWDGYDYPRLAWEPGPNTPMVFVDINDPDFKGQMSKYEITNTQYCDFLNAALASGDITPNGNKVEGANGLNSGEDYTEQSYYKLDGSGYTGYGATNGGATRIHYNEGEFSVDEDFGNHPVTYVSWYGAIAFSNYYGYYLPTEDQWQAVADYDGTYIYGCGETIDPGIANYRDSEHPDGTVPVGSFGTYGYGMSDMAGNVWEWTSSSLDDNRVFRGGSMGGIDSDCDVSIRGDGIPYANYWDIGFRVCR